MDCVLKAPLSPHYYQRQGRTRFLLEVYYTNATEIQYLLVISPTDLAAIQSTRAITAHGGYGEEEEEDEELLLTLAR